MIKTSAIILAGGNSSRFGIPKTFLSYDDTLSFLERIVKVYLDFGCKKIVLVINKNHSELFHRLYPRSFRSRLKVIYNSKPELGRFYSLQLGASAISRLGYCFVQNIDNPFTDLITLKMLFDNRRADAYVSPSFLKKGGHPILIPAIIFDYIREEQNTDMNLKEFLGSFNKISVEVNNEKILANINTPDEYDSYFKSGGLNISNN